MICAALPPGALGVSLRCMYLSANSKTLRGLRWCSVDWIACKISASETLPTVAAFFATSGSRVTCISTYFTTLSNDSASSGIIFAKMALRLLVSES